MSSARPVPPGTGPVTNVTVTDFPIRGRVICGLAQPTCMGRRGVHRGLPLAEGPSGAVPPPGGKPGAGPGPGARGADGTPAGPVRHVVLTRQTTCENVTL